MKTYRVYLCYAKDFVVRANSENEAIDKAHEGDVISEGSLDPWDEYDYVEIEENYEDYEDGEI